MVQLMIFSSFCLLKLQYAIQVRFQIYCLGAEIQGKAERRQLSWLSKVAFITSVLKQTYQYGHWDKWNGSITKTVPHFCIAMTTEWFFPHWQHAWHGHILCLLLCLWPQFMTSVLKQTSHVWLAKARKCVIKSVWWVVIAVMSCLWKSSQTLVYDLCWEKVACYIT